MSSASTIVLITGANAGIGFATTKVIVSTSESYHVIIAGRNIEKCDQALSEIQTSGGIKGTLSTLLLDVSDKSSIDAAAKKVTEQFGRIDVLVNNAGVATRASTVAEQLEGLLGTNLIGAVRVSETFRDLLLKSKKPYSIYMSSGLGSIGYASDPSKPYYDVPAVGYRASKAALNMVAVQEHKDFASKGVKVFTMCPGLVVSNLSGMSKEDQLATGAGDPEDSGRIVLSIIEGKRDEDVGKFVHADGVYPW